MFDVPQTSQTMGKSGRRVVNKYIGDISLSLTSQSGPELATGFGAVESLAALSKSTFGFGGQKPDWSGPIEKGQGNIAARQVSRILL